MKTFADIFKKLDEIRFPEAITNDDGIKVIRVTYFDNNFDDIFYNEDQLQFLNQIKDSNRTRRNLMNKATQLNAEAMIDEEVAKTKAAIDAAVEKEPSLKDEGEKVKAEIDAHAEKMKNGEEIDADEPTFKEKALSALVKVGAGVAVGVGALALVTALKGCSTDEEPQIIPENQIETVVETPETEQPNEDAKDTVVDYDRAVKDINAMTDDINATLEANGQETVDAESYAAYYNWLNMENIDPMAFLQEQQNNLVPVGATEAATTSFMAIDTIGHNNTLYMYGEDVKMVSILPYVVDPDNKAFVEIVENTEKVIRELSIKQANGTLTDADKERATQIYNDIYNYLRSQGGSAFGNHNNHNEGVTKMVDVTIMNSMLQALGRAGFINLEQIDALIGKDIDLATGKGELRSQLNEWANAMGEWNKLCDAANSYVYAVPEEEAQQFTYGK